MDMIVFLNVKPEDNENFRMALEKLELDKRPMTNAEKQKAYRERKKVTVGNEMVTDGNAEAEEKEEVLPLSSPSSLPPYNPYPITPYNPPLPEEREEDYGGADGKRGELRSFGPHVKLSEKEFLKLQEDFGYEETMRMIRSMNDYIGEDPKLIAKYRTRNHNLTLRNWKRRDEEKNKAMQPKKRESWTEIAEKLSEEMNLV